jgi:hypothetical protein
VLIMNGELAELDGQTYGKAQDYHGETDFRINT